MILRSLTKKLGAVLTTTALLSVAVFSASAVPTVGDINADGNVDVNDATYLQKILADLETAPDDLEVVAQTYADGKIDIKDATAIQLYGAQLIDALPLNPNSQETQPTESSSQEATEPSSDDTESTQPTQEATEKPTDEATEPSSDETESTQPTESSTQSTTQRGTDEEGWNDGIYRPFSL